MKTEDTDKHLDAILRASGSALKHYSMQKTRDDMRAALRAAVSAGQTDLLAALEYLVQADEDIQEDRGTKSNQAMNRIAALDMAARATAKARGHD